MLSVAFPKEMRYNFSVTVSSERMIYHALSARDRHWRERTVQRKIKLFTDRFSRKGGRFTAEFQKNLAMAKAVAEAVATEGGRAYFVGGYVRDLLRGIPNSDIDIEVHGLSPEKLEAILDSLGKRITVGESFGIYGLRGTSLDIAMPRKEENRGRGHRDFDICVDPFIGIEKAAKRRDFTVNAMMQDVLTGEIFDPYGGRNDLEKGILRAVSEETFPEDPLRVLRAAQFAARLGFSVEPKTLSFCRNMKLDALPPERIFEEVKKALLYSEKPSVFFEVLRKMEQLSVWFPELADLIGVPQNPIHHAEGDVWTHTMMVLDAAAGYKSRAQNPLGFMLAALCHDFGKISVTEMIGGVIHAYNHEHAGLPLIRGFLQRLTSEKALCHYVLNLCEYHMKPGVLAGAHSSVKVTNHLFDESVDPEALIVLSLSDGFGKLPPEDNSNEAFLEERLALYRESMAKPFVTGQDLIDAGFSPSADFRRRLSYAHKLRLAGVPKEEALRQTLHYKE